MADTTATKNPQPEANYKDTVESILVAFILAFIFRAFVVEAFVIPTGSMATTLYGAHMRLTCPDCGYTFDVGYHTPPGENGEDVDNPPTIKRPANIRCPNCAYDFPTKDAMGAPIQEPVRNGDRILVLKYLYLAQKPQRWDVVVFKSPHEDHPVPEDPEYGQNYIKRLIGTPGESIVILDGDVYVGSFDANDPDKFQIQRKPAFVQDRLWRIVADNDYLPGHASSRSTTWHQPWRPVSNETGWTIANDGLARVFDFNNSGGSSTIFFNPDANHVNPDANRDINSLTDWISYDQLEEEARHGDGPWVSDLKLSCFYTRKSGDGPLRLYLTKSNHCFVAEITPGKVSLYHSSKLAALSDLSSGRGFDPGPLTLVKSASIPQHEGSAPVQIDFMNYDYQIVLKIDGKDAFPAYEYPPDVKRLWQNAVTEINDPLGRPEVRISADHQSCSLEHISLWHDIYYGNRSGSSIPFWASPENVMHLNAGEYFVLGDNSFISGDARYWRDPIRLPHEGLPDTQGGRVPESFMLGKAFFVYWPAGYWPPYISKGIVPDFGEMRFIH